VAGTPRWNLSHGVPLLTWPHFVDQFLIEALFVDMFGAGICVNIKVPVVHPEVSKFQIGTEEVVKVVAEMRGRRYGRGQ
jgi:hypothetical protein